jgi:hypothetical protein
VQRVRNHLITLLPPPPPPISREVAVVAAVVLAAIMVIAMLVRIMFILDGACCPMALTSVFMTLKNLHRLPQVPLLLEELSEQDQYPPHHKIATVPHRLMTLKLPILGTTLGRPLKLGLLVEVLILYLLEAGPAAVLAVSGRALGHLICHLVFLTVDG